MSGRKYSRVALANNVREAISCRLAAEEALARAEGLAAALGEAADNAPSLARAAAEASATLAGIQEQLDAMAADFEESRLMRLELTAVQQRRRRVDDLTRQLEELVRRCRDGRDAAALRADLKAVLDQLERDRSEIEPWLRDVYAGHVETGRGLLDGLDNAMQNSGGAGDNAAEIADYTAEYETLRQRVAKRRAQDAERRYVAQALREVCAEMGFSATARAQDGPLEDLVVEVDTFAYGVIHFRLELGGTIRSESELVESSCFANFAVIEDRLKSLGVISAFRYEGDQRPVRLEKGAKSLPDSGDDAVARDAVS